MANHQQLLLSALCTAALLVAAAAQAGPDADTREVNTYRLSEAGLAKYSRATDGLAAVRADNPAACDEDADMESLDGMAASIDAIPGASAALGAVGMSSREYALFTMSLVQSALGAWVVTQGGGLPAEIAFENVQFFQEHEMQLQQLIEQQETIKCESPEDNQGDKDEAWAEDSDEEYDG